MPNELDPIVGQWYEQRDRQILTQVIAVEREADVIEMQDFDGAIEAVDFETWRTLDLEAVEPPEDWTGPYDDVEADDLGYVSEGATSTQDWRTPLDALRTHDDVWHDSSFDQDAPEARPVINTTWGRHGAPRQPR